MGQAVPPISVTCSKWYIRKAPLCSWGSAFGLVHWVTDSLLNKLASWKLWCPISLSKSSYISEGLSGIRRVVLSPPGGQLNVPSLLGGPARPATTRSADPGGGSLSSDKLRQVLVAQRNPERLGNQLGSPLVRLVRTWVWIQTWLRRQKGSMINSQQDTLVTAFWVKPCLSGSGSGVDVLCCVRVYKIVSLRQSPAAKQMQNPDLQVHGKLMIKGEPWQGLQSGTYTDSLWPRDA
jgi:hypothetical protein